MRASSALVLLALCTASACGGTGAASAPPDVLVVVWDTTRSDRLSAYGYDTATTPWLERFQAEATTFDCLAPGSNTIATHGSLFTGLPPRAHGATFRNKRLPADHETLAERLSAHGYATWLYSANPVLSSPVGFDQGFEVVDHPWDEDRADAAVAAMLPKVRGGDNGTGVRVRLEGGEWGGSDLTGSGELAAPATEAFLAGLARDDDDRPVFALVNLMDAHYPLLPARPFRERVMDAEAIAESYAISRRWNDLWRDTAGVEPIDERARAVASAMYDAAMAELDAHTEALVAVFLDGLGPERAARAIVAVTSDHGEHLGERYGGVPMHDHRYSLYDELLRVPLVVRAPGHLEQGAWGSGAMVQDLFPSILRWTGAEPGDSVETGYARPLGSGSSKPRPRLSEYLDDFGVPAQAPTLPEAAWDATGLGGPLVTVREGGSGVGWRPGARTGVGFESPVVVHPNSGGFAGWSAASTDFVELEPSVRTDREADLERYEAETAPHPRLYAGPSELTDEQMEMLERLGYGDLAGGH